MNEDKLKNAVILEWVNILIYSLWHCALLFEIFNLLYKSTYALEKDFLLTPSGPSPYEVKENCTYSGFI